MEQFIEFVSNHWILSSAWVVVCALLLMAHIKHLTNGVRSLVPQEVTHLINREDALVVDIRPIADFNKGHIVGSVNIPQSKVTSSSKELEKHKSKPIIIVCANGMQAGSVCEQLKKADYTAHKLSGGFQSWLGENLPVVKK
ncbi:rhodanese-like domain-containing protein [Pleionea sp. CnH1-48]|uniref:rhodanese-like domain-containing protein n=1 Tax=Pleionea sp. CnH1-48 TaxID=2954494 RepID=UPI002096F41A|nr:rhodanese-like domain-containing protein [Pleionea sp. CnH1-48]MCO7225168.1 rhodanese-like domain-containing protein [Pleionea sp. CnH1-48]